MKLPGRDRAGGDRFGKFHRRAAAVPRRLGRAPALSGRRRPGRRHARCAGLHGAREGRRGPLCGHGPPHRNGDMAPAGNDELPDSETAFDI